jgi:hypothetical protein
MRLKETSFTMNVTTNGSSTPDFTQDIGQSNSYFMDYAGFNDICVAMLYYQVKDIENVTAPLGKGGKRQSLDNMDNYSLELASIFDNIYVNNVHLDNQKFIMFVIKEQRETHCGRRQLKFSKDARYKDLSYNEQCIDAIGVALNCLPTGSWVVTDINISREKDSSPRLDFTAVVMNSNASVDFKSTSQRTSIIGKRRQSLINNGLLTANNGIEHRVEKSIADLITGHDSDKLSLQSLQMIAKSMYDGSGDSEKVRSMHLFGIMYAPHIEGNANKISEYVKAGSAYGTEITKGKNVGFYLRSKIDHSDEYVEFDPQIVPLQQIFFGAPGTSKSTRIKSLIGNKEQHRVTFHPDTDYASFVGCYKPSKDDNENVITYKFVAQPFINAYISAWKKLYDENEVRKEVFLVIEEINRGNCAQIFGDLFQLLDRDSEGYSDYSIEPDSDLCRYLKAEFANSDIPIQGIKEGRIMKLPPNLFIWATMNTSDQSLFPIDSAFKRRWDWKYTPIKNGEKGHVIALSDRQYDWWEFLDAVNKRIEKVTESEDKQLGYWFAKPEKGISISSEKFVSKVVFYLWNDVFKDYGHDVNSPFVIKQDDGKKVELRFKSFFDENGDVDESVLIQFFWGLKLQTKAAAPTQAEEDKEDDETPTLEPIGVKESIADQPPTEDESSVDAFEDNEEELPEAKSIDDFFNS